MKKLFLAAAVFTTVVGCSKNEVSEKTNPELIQNFIRFSTLNDKTGSSITRNANDQNTTFGVFARETGSTKGWYIEGVEAKAISNSIDIPWPNVKLDFYAYAPFTGLPGDSVVMNKEETRTTISIKPPTNALMDFTMASILDQSSSETAVALQFKHKLSKIVITGNKSLDMDRSYVLEMGHATLKVNNSTGTITVGTSSETDVISFPSTETETYTSIGKVTDNATKSATFYIIPQPSEGCTVIIKGVTITRNGHTANVAVTHTFDAAGVTFAPGNQYNLNFTIKGDGISFSTSMKPWDQGAGTEL